MRRLPLPMVASIVATALSIALSLSAPKAVRAAGVELVISAAASLTGVITELKPRFEAAYPNVRLVLNFGSSGALQQQIERGAPVDVFIAAAEAPVEQLVRRGFIAQSAVRHVAANRLVLIVPARPGAAFVHGWKDLRGERVRRVGIGNPDHVPAGAYAKQALEFLGLWNELRPKLVMGEDVRQVLQYVRLGAVDAGIVYATDAASVPDVAVVAEAPSGSHSPIVYPVAPIQTSRHPEEVGAFIEFLFSDEAQAILSRHGFAPAE